jgi:hypothetical protein
MIPHIAGSLFSLLERGTIFARMIRIFPFLSEMIGDFGRAGCKTKAWIESQLGDCVNISGVKVYRYYYPGTQTLESGNSLCHIITFPPLDILFVSYHKQ